MGRKGASSSVDRPLRTCIGCRRRSQQRTLVRFAVAGGAVVVDADQRLTGRGAYLCRRTECATRVLSDGRRLARALRTSPDHVTVDGTALLQDWRATLGTDPHRTDAATTAADDAPAHRPG